MKKALITFCCFFFLTLSSCGSNSASSGTNTRKSTVRFYGISESTHGNISNQLIQESEWQEGSIPVFYGETPKRAGHVNSSFKEDYEFADWTTIHGEYDYDSAFEWNPNYIGIKPCEHGSNYDYYPLFRKKLSYHIIFYSDVYDVLYDAYFAKGEKVTYNGPIPTKESDQKYNYVFSGWKSINGDDRGTVYEPDKLPVASSTQSYEAQYTKNLVTYTVKWQNYNGAVLETDTVEYGGSAHYDGPTPTRESTERYIYTFNGWDTYPSYVTSDIVVTARYIETLRRYTVTWADYDGYVLSSEGYEYGNIPTYKSTTPTRPSSEEYDYTFSGWSPSITAVTRDITYVAQYSRTERVHYYTVTWKNYDGTVLEIDTNVAAGTFPTYNGSTPTKPASGNYSYTFSGWTPALSNVYSDVTYTATFEEVEENPYENAVKAIGDKNLYLDNLSFTDGASVTWEESLRSSTNTCEIYLSNNSSGTDGTYGYYYQTRSFHVTLTFDPTDKEKQVVSYEHYCSRFYEEESAHGEDVWMKATGSATVDLYRSKGDSIVLSNFGGSKGGVQYLIVRLPSMTDTTEARRCGMVFDELLKQISQRVPVSLADLGYVNY